MSNELPADLRETQRFLAELDDEAELLEADLARISDGPDKEELVRKMANLRRRIEEAIRMRGRPQ